MKSAQRIWKARSRNERDRNERDSNKWVKNYGDPKTKKKI